MKYNWQLKDWPNFTFDSEKVGHLHVDYLKNLAELQGKVSMLSQVEQNNTYVNLMVEEALSTSKIEGENLNREDVRSSVVKHLNIPGKSTVGFHPKENGIATMLVDVRKEFKSPLSKELICKWHSLLLEGSESDYLKPILIGDYRKGPVEIVRGSYEYEEVIFEAPLENIDAEMEVFISWFNSTNPSISSSYLPGPVRAAVAHIWFNSIHPFEDGNGRLSRAISEQALFQEYGTPVMFSLSGQIQSDRKKYYEKLGQTQWVNPSMDITDWVEWFTSTVRSAQLLSSKKVEAVIDKAKFWDTNAEKGINERQSKALNSLFDSSIKNNKSALSISSSRYQALTKCSRATAARDLMDLVNKGCLELTGAGRSVAYEIVIVQPDDLFKKPKDLISLEGFFELKKEQLLKEISRKFEFYRDVSEPEVNELVLEYLRSYEKDNQALMQLQEVIGDIKDPDAPQME